MSKLAHSNDETMAQIEAQRVLEDPHNMEAEANAFAMELLMPEFLMRQEMAKLKHIDIEDEKAVETLAKKFRVSRQVMTIRLGQLLGVV